MQIVNGFLLNMVLDRVQMIICIYLNFSIVMENIKAVIKWRT